MAAERLLPLVKALKSLHSLKVIEEVVVSPTVVFIGDESAIGKRTLIEAFAGVKLENDSHSTTKAKTRKEYPEMELVELPEISDLGYDGIRDMLEKETPHDRILINVVGANTEFERCLSTRLAQSVDPEGKRTVTVVTGCDKFPDGIWEKLMGHMDKLGRKQVCLIEPYDEAASKEEEEYFTTHLLLSVIPNSMVGIRVLLNTLVEITLEAILLPTLPGIIEQVETSLLVLKSEEERLQRSLTVGKPIFLHKCFLIKESLEAVLIKADPVVLGGEGFKWSSEVKSELTELLEKISKESDLTKGGMMFLAEEMELLKSSMGIGLPHYSWESSFRCCLIQKVKNISGLIFDLINNIWNKLETIGEMVIGVHCADYPCMLLLMKKAIQKRMCKTKERLMKEVSKMLDMEKSTQYTCDPQYLTSVEERRVTYLEQFSDKLGDCDQFKLRDEAFELKLKIDTYWDIVTRRLVDWMTLHLWSTLEEMVTIDMELNAASGGIDLHPSVIAKIEMVGRKINILNNLKDCLTDAAGMDT